MKKIVLGIVFFSIASSYAQQNVFSRDNSGTGNWWDGANPWYYESWGNNQQRPDINDVRNNVFIGHNSFTNMSVNGRFFLMRTLTIQNGASNPRTYNKFDNGGISLTTGLYINPTASQTFNVPFGIDGSSVEFVTAGALNLTDAIFINSNTLLIRGAGNTTVSGVMQGANGKLTKEGTGILQLNAQNTYTGLTTVSGGTLQLNRTGGNSLPDSNNVVINANGTFKVSSNQTLNAITINGGILQVDAGVTLNVNTITITNGGSISGTGVVRLLDEITLNSGTFSTNSNLVLVSTATKTARVGTVGSGASFSGSVTVERFIPSRRAWRILAAPLRGATTNTIASNWQGTTGEGVLLFSPATYQGQAMTGYTTGGGAPNILKFNAGWQKIPDLTTEPLFGANATDTNAFLVFPTGPVGSTNIASSTGSTATTLRPKGTLITGNVAHTLVADTYKLLANPYASALDTEALVAANSGAKLWLLDPSSALGAYVTYDGSNWSVVPSAADKNIQSGQGFLVKSTGTSFTFSESHKTAGSSTNWFSRNTAASATNTSNTDKIRLTLYKQINNEWVLADGALAVHAATDANEVDAKDASKLSNFNESLMFVNGTTNLAIEYRNLPEPTTVQPIKLTGTSATAYQLRVATENYTNSNLIPVLEDTLLNTITEIPADGTVVSIPFTGVAATASNPDVRYRITYRTTLNQDDFNKLGVTVYPNPVTDGLINIRLANNTNVATCTVHNLLGQFVAKTELTQLDNQLEVANLKTGFYILEIAQEGKKFSTKIYVE